VADAVAQGLTSDEFAVQVFAAIEAGKFWIVPGEGFKRAIELRTRCILEERQPPSTEEIMRELQTSR